MRRRFASIAVTILTAPAAAWVFAAEAPGGREVSFKAEDGITIHGDLYLTGDSRAGPFLLLFHQGDGDARGEYRPLVGRLMEAGYSALAIDQRVGGNLFGGQNRTSSAIVENPHYCEAYPDLVAALRWVEEEGFTGPKIAWGSSYSGALALRLAGEHGGRLAGVIAFSPATGEPMEGCRAESYAEKVAIPALVLRPLSEMSRDMMKEQFEVFRKVGVRTLVVDPGVHGSSMLNPDRVEGSVEETWRLVLSFLAEAAAGGPDRGR